MNMSMIKRANRDKYRNECVKDLELIEINKEINVCMI